MGLCIHLQWGKEAFTMYFGTNSMEVYVCIVREHKINKEYKRSMFSSVSSPEYGSLYTWQKYQRPVWSHHWLFTLRNKSTQFRVFLNSCLLEFWWWNVAVCSIPYVLNFWIPPFGIALFYQVPLMSRSLLLHGSRSHLVLMRGYLHLVVHRVRSLNTEDRKKKRNAKGGKRRGGCR